MTADFAHNAPARDQRTIKATALARQLYTELTPARRREIARSAGVRPGSDETWSEAARLLAERFAWDVRNPAGGAP